MKLLRVQRLDGENFDITVDRETVRDVKDIICKHWRVPPPCQQLIMGSNILDDGDDIVVSYSEHNEHTCVTMLISFDQINRDLMQGCIQAQKSACDVLCLLITDKAYNQVLSSHASGMIVGLLQETWDVDSALKCQLVKALGSLVQQGSGNAASALCFCISDAHQNVRNSAVKSLHSLREEHHEYALCALSSYVNHPKWQIRCAAVKGVDSFSKVGSRDAIAVVKRFSTDLDDSVRMFASGSYNRLAQIGSNRGSVGACHAIRR